MILAQVEACCTCAVEDCAFLYELLYGVVRDGSEVHCGAVGC